MRRMKTLLSGSAATARGVPTLVRRIGRIAMGRHGGYVMLRYTWRDRNPKTTTSHPAKSALNPAKTAKTAPNPPNRVKPA